MKKFAEYIQRIEIKALWGKKNIVWNLRPDVNILSGINGIGKSTILNESVRSLNVLENHSFSAGTASVKMVFHPEDATAIRFAPISRLLFAACSLSLSPFSIFPWLIRALELYPKKVNTFIVSLAFHA